ncbi:MAG: hypothetical protein NC132_02525 [Corallococcus sp.]|nr:hypothetical protein [Corallococcus sp.]MCM1358983.1 hypothetical protein [Corallococcus sp.]MCM1394972.1 hypothetical protein [Corallococcus sp.]
MCEALKVLEDWTSSEVKDNNSYGDSQFPSATRLYTSTIKFNCHSYAWYSQDCNTNDIWIDDPTNLIGGNYYETSTPVVGDRICYYNSYGINLHSGIVEEVLGGSSNGVCGNSNTVTIVSKWGGCGLYRHRGDQCPYPNLTGENKAVSVKYFHKHSYKYSYTWKNLQKHYSYCACGDYKEQGHVIKKNDFSALAISPIKYEKCLYCGGNAETGFVLSLSTKYSENGSFVLPNGVLVLADKDIQTYFEGFLNFECDYDCLTYIN